MDDSRRQKWALPPGHFSRIYRVIGRVVAARGLPNTDTRGKSDPYCVVKGIRSNNHMANIWITKAAQNTLSPHWEESFDYMVPPEWGLVELVGLKAMVFDADDYHISYQGNEDFLGGCDIDLSGAVTGRAMNFELELAGIPVNKAKGKKPRLTIVVTVYKEVIPKPEPLMDQLLESVRKMEYIREVVGKVVKAQALRNADLVGASDPQCIVRVILLNGEAREIHRTEVIKDNLDPEWHEGFHAKFEHDEQPLLLVFDIWDCDSPTKPAEESGEHLGSAVIPLLDCLPPVARNHKLNLQGETQLHEQRLNKNGIKGIEAKVQLDDGTGRPSLDSAHLSDRPLEEEKEKPKLSCLDRLTKAAVDLREKVKSAYYLQKVERPSLTVEIRTRTKAEPMPLQCFMDKAVYVADEDDAKAVLKKPEAHWDRSMFSPPAELLEKGRPPRGELSGLQQIVFIYGTIRGASGLPAADDNQLSDPFCVVEALSRTAGKLFLHRTRVIKQKLCPEFNETFYMPIPQGFECNRIMFSIYDRDETFGAIVGSGVDPLEQDEFLGRASVDISYLMSGEKLVEDIPVSGSFVGSQVKTTTGFRRVATISIELSMQRRVKPCYGLAPEDHSTVIPRRTHKVSRQPYSVVYADPSQFMTEVPLEEQIAMNVMDAHSTGRLIKGAGQADWIQKPREAPEMIPESKPQILDVRRAKPQSEPPGLDFTQHSPVQRCDSLPILHSKFEQTPALFEMTQPHRGKGKLSIRQAFNSQSTQSIMQSLKGLWFKPMPDTLIHRKVEPSASSAEKPESPHGDMLLR